MLHDRILLEPGPEAGERTSSAGIVIPATASMGRRLVWGTVVAAGPHVRQAGLGDTVLYDPAELAEVELEGQVYVLLRARHPRDLRTGRGLERGDVPVRSEIGL